VSANGGEPLSVFVTTFNNAVSLAGCLKSVEWADEILLLDSFSTDETLEIARRHGCTIHQQEFMGYGPQKQRAMALTRNRWVLLLDADEMLSPELAEEIRELLAAGPVADGYWLRRHEQHYWRMSSFAVRPDYFLRLFDKTKGRVTDKPVHAAPAVDGRTKRLRHHFVHFGMTTLHIKVRKINDYSSGLVKDKVARAKAGNPLMMVFYPPFYFLRHYLVERQFMNGWVGFMGAAINAFYAFLKYAKLYEHYQWERHGTGMLPEGAPPVDRADRRGTT
jgi:glycosyltransferase involved in cell wall biosynthesis